MFSLQFVIAIGLLYLGLLFVVGFVGERLPSHRLQSVRPFMLALAATYTSAWMFFGTPAQAVEDGWIVPPTFLGAITALILFEPVIRRLVSVAHQRRSNNIADFIANLYGNSQAIAVIVTVTALIAILPYLSLQLRAIADSISLLTATDSSRDIWVSGFTSLVLGFFAAVFGAAYVDSGRSRNGMLMAVAADAIVKILAFLVLAAFAVFGLFDGPSDLIRTVVTDTRFDQLQSSWPVDTGFVATFVFGMLAVICLPRQFHLLAVESQSSSDLGVIRSLTPLYLLMLSIAAPVIGYAGWVVLGDGYTNAEMFALGLPLEMGGESLSLFTFIGGLSAGASMLLIASIALSNMVNNTLITPLWLRRSKRTTQAGSLGLTMRRSRRVTIAVVMLVAFGLERLISTDLRLGTFGVISLALVAQLAPALLLKLYWQAARPWGAIAGILAGSAVVLSSTVSFHLLGEDFVASLLGLEWNSYTVACVFGLSANALTIIGVSWLLASGADRSPPNPKKSKALEFDGVYQLVAGFVGDEAATAVLGKTAQQANPQYDSEVLESARRLLAGIVGSNVAERLLGDKTPRSDQQSSLSTVQDIYQFGRGLLQSSIDNIEQGISVVDANLNLVAWNQPYVALHDYPKQMIYVGQSVEELVRYNAQRGLCGPGDAAIHVETATPLPVSEATGA